MACIIAALPPAVHVVYLRARGKYAIRWRESGRFKQKTCGSKAAATAARLDKLQSPRAESTAATGGPGSWPGFWARYLAIGLAGRADSTLDHARSVFRAVRPPTSLQAISPAWAAAALADLLQRHSPATAESYAKRLRAGLRWGARMGYCQPCPLSIPEASRARGRALAVEEFERMGLAATVLFDPDRAAAYQWLLAGLWASGLRLSEALDLSWDDARHWLLVDLGHAHRWPTIHIPATRQKSRQNEIIPAAPELVTLCLQVPYDQRRGPIFHSDELGARSAIGKRIAACGRRAGIDVGGRFASAHDLRRSFALRWAEAGLAEAELARLMRHKSIETTRQYYEVIEAQRLGQRLYSLSKQEPHTCFTATATAKRR